MPSDTIRAGENTEEATQESIATRNGPALSNRACEITYVGSLGLVSSQIDVCRVAGYLSSINVLILKTTPRFASSGMRYA